MTLRRAHVLSSATSLALTAACGRLGFAPGGEPDAAPAPDAAAGPPTALTLTLDRFTPGEPLVDFPLMVRLGEAELPAAWLRADRRNVQFLDEDGATLGHAFDPSAPSGEVIAWVQVPRWSGVQTIQLRVDMLDVRHPTATSPWSAAYVFVHHLHDGANAAGAGFALSPLLASPAVVPGLSGDGLRFDAAASQCLEVSDDPALRGTAWTVSAWHRPTVVPSKAMPWITAVARQEGTGVLDDFALGPRAEDQPGAWHHVAYVLAAGQVEGFRDGVSEGAPRATTGDSPNPIHVGCDQNGVDLNEFFDGTLDEVRFERVARSAAWLQADVASVADQVISVSAP